MTLTELRERPHWSYSALNQFLNICSLQFAFDRVYKLAKQFTPVALSFGSVFHRVNEWMAMTRMEGKKPATKEASDLFQTLWTRQIEEDGNIRFDDDTTPDSCADQGRNLVACACDNVDPDEQVLGVNIPFAVPLVDPAGRTTEKPLIGEIDLVVEKSGRPQLVDWKSSARRWPRGKADKDLQPTVLLYAWQQLHEETPAFRFDVITKAKIPVLEQHLTERCQDHFDRMVTLAGKVEAMVRAEHFLPNETSFYCGSCPHSAACREWHRAASRVSVRMPA